MEKIKITCDSACDLSSETYRAYQIMPIPVHVISGGKQYLDMVNIRLPDVFRIVDSTGQLPTTAAISSYEYEEVFRRYRKEGYTVIHINISSKLTSCHQNARIAAENYENVYVFDSQNVSSASGYLAMEASDLARRGSSAGEILEKLSELRRQMEVSFLVDTLSYLHMGGRCSAIVALGANLLKLKPCIEMCGGSLRVGKKYRGSLKRSVCHYIRDKLENRPSIQRGTILMTHAMAPGDVLEEVRREIRKFLPGVKIIENITGCTIGSHCGPSTLGIGILRRI